MMERISRIEQELYKNRQAIRILAREIDKINKTNCKPNNTLDEVEQTLQHD